jgi:hypothetical protein
MAPREPRVPAGVPEVLAALTGSTRGPVTLHALTAATGLSAGAAARALVELQSFGWLRTPSGSSGFRLAPLPADAADRLPGADPLRMAERHRSDGRTDVVHRLNPIARSVIDAAVERLPFLDAVAYREQLRAAVAQHGCIVQITEAMGALRVRGPRPRRCRWGRHHFVLRRDSSTSVGHTYFECGRCGTFQNSLFGDAVDRRSHPQPEPSH